MGKITFGPLILSISMLNFLLERFCPPLGLLDCYCKGEDMCQESLKKFSKGETWMGFYGAEPVLGDKGGYHQL